VGDVEWGQIDERARISLTRSKSTFKCGLSTVSKVSRNIDTDDLLGEKHVASSEIADRFTSNTRKRRARWDGWTRLNGLENSPTRRLQNSAVVTSILFLDKRYKRPRLSSPCDPRGTAPHKCQVNDEVLESADEEEVERHFARRRIVLQVRQVSDWNAACTTVRTILLFSDDRWGSFNLARATPFPSPPSTFLLRCIIYFFLLFQDRWFTCGLLIIEYFSILLRFSEFFEIYKSLRLLQHPERHNFTFKLRVSNIYKLWASNT